MHELCSYLASFYVQDWGQAYLDLDEIVRFIGEARQFEPKHDDKLQKVSLSIDEKGNVSSETGHLSDEGLAEMLKARAIDPQFQLQIQADTAVNYGRVAQVMAIAQKAGVSKLSFLTIGGK